jgi:hypothetical protein
MTAKREQQSPPEDVERFRKELSLKKERLVAESLEGWPVCNNARCRRTAVPARTMNASPNGAKPCRRFRWRKRSNRIWNDYVASLPAEQDKKREPGPRITML